MNEHLKSYPRLFVATNVKVDSWKSIENYLDELLKREIPDEASLKKWLLDFSELISVVYEEGTSREVAMTCHTDDEELKNRHFDFVENIDSPFKEAVFKLYQKFLAHPLSAQSGAENLQLLLMIKTEVELFSQKNIPLEVREVKLCQHYQEITGSWMVDFEGKEYTMPEMAVFLESNNAELREKTFKAMANRRIQDKDKLNRLFTNMLELRGQIAANVGLSSYRDYLFKQNRREYTPEDCALFHESVLKEIVPVVKKMRDKKASQLGLKALNPWDNVCDPMNYPPLRPFANVNELQNGVENIFGLVDTRLQNYFQLIRGQQDLDSRRGKAPGGYQATFEEQRMPFIFMNAAGVQDDVETLLHESGHSFHSLQYRNQELYWYRGAPMEFCEVSSMSFELIGGAHFDVFYKDGLEASRARLKHLTSILELFPWVMTVDAFQHWIYENPKHTLEEREDKWREIHQKFDAGIDWTRLPQEVQKNWWHKQLHIFLDPFYYIEYAISQLGALQIYRNYKNNPKKTLDDFLRGMSLGASKSCREIFQAAGIEFRFDVQIVGELANMVYEEIQQLENDSTN